jgi:high-affinity Fe2+/Pb2+ permease
MSKLTLYFLITTTSIIAYADLPLYFLFGVVLTGIMIEIDKVEKKVYPIVSTIVLSSVVGWAISFGVKHFKPEWFLGDLKIFTMFITTLFSYVTIVYLLKNETVQKIVAKYINKKTDGDSKNT